MEVREWYRVQLSDQGIRLHVSPPDRDAWQADIRWDEICRVCFKPEFLMTDGLYLFTTSRPESYVVPTEADGGPELLEQLIKRKLFDGNLYIEAAKKRTVSFAGHRSRTNQQQLS